MSDTHAACMNFVNALEKIPDIIAQYEERTANSKPIFLSLKPLSQRRGTKRMS